MRVLTAKEAARAKKEAGARQRACFDEEITHLRVGDWRGRDDQAAITVVGRCADLHGTVCTCCRRTPP